MTTLHREQLLKAAFQKASILELKHMDENEFGTRLRSPIMIS